MKIFRLFIISCAVSVLLISTAAFGQSSPQVSQPATVTREAASTNTQAQADTPLCYAQLPNGRTVNLSEICGDQTNGARLAQSTYSQPPVVYDDAAIKAFDDSVYGPEG